MLLFLAITAMPEALRAGAEPAALEDAAQQTGPATDATRHAPAPPAPDSPARRGPEEPYFSNFSANEPMYFVLGWRGSSNAKFQISFKYRFVNPEAFVASRASFLKDLSFCYTQTSLWDLGAESAPFHDTSYRPSLVYGKDDTGARPLGTSRFGIQGGLEHESNGKDGDESRSINLVFLRPVLIYGDLADHHFTVSPKAWIYLSKDENPDIDDYRGYADLLLVYEKRDQLQVAATVRKGVENGYGSFQVDASYPLSQVLSRTFNLYLHVQYFSGWGETILDYNQRKPWQVRVGIMIIRW
jgi:outer membrane phospholipase A